MSLSSDLISQFIKATNDEKKPKSEATVYGTVKYDGKYYVQLDGSELLTPVETTTDVKDGERVTVTIKDHTATITGNLTSPSARTDDVQTIGKQISEFEIIIADKVDTKQLEAESARIEQLVAGKASIESLAAVEATVGELKASDVEITGKLDANEAEIESLKTGKLDVETANAEFATIKQLESTYATIENLEATNLDVYNLEATHAEFETTTTKKLDAVDADIKNLDTQYAKIDFANIGSAAIEKLFSDSGIIESLVVSDGKITGELVGVTISGDLIKGNTIQAEKLIIKGEDGLYHKLNIEGGVTTTETLTEEDLQNGLHGSVIIAKSITAESIAVNDLVAFDATIGGFEITDDSIHTVAKEIPESSNKGIYLGNDGQFAIGDGDNYVKYIKDENNIFKLLIAAGSIAEQIENATSSLAETVEKVNKHFTFDSDGITISNGTNTLSLQLDAGVIRFKKNGSQFGWWDGTDFHTGNIKIEVTERAQFGNFGFVPRSDGSLSFLKLEHRTGFYAILNGTVMSIFAAYPILEGTTMNMNDISCEVSDTTIILNEGE